MAPPDGSVVLVDGPWTHREVTANGAKFHLAEAGPADGPLVLLLHGFPQFWWCWRFQLEALAAAGFRAVAPDLRGYGASDKPPRGYDAYTLSSDVAGMVRALGARDAVLVGHDWGGALAWTTATFFPGLVRRLAVVSMPHPLRLRQALLTDPRGQLRASSYIGFFQVPKAPENRLRREDGTWLRGLLDEWGGPGFPDEEAAARYVEAMQIPAAAHCSLEYYRWAIRSLSRPSGWRFQRLLAHGVSAPTLHLHGELDGCLLPSTVEGSGGYVRSSYELRMLDGVGHFLPEEAPDEISAALVAHARA